MKCADPVLCYTDGVTKKFRHYSLASPIFRQQSNLVFNCGKCIFCRKKKSYELSIRCVLHASTTNSSSFITLTYDEKKAQYNNQFIYSDIQKFKKRLRQHIHRSQNTKIDIFNVHEYGKNGKKHWHLVIFGYDFPDKEQIGSKNQNAYYSSEELTKLWPYGYHTIGSVTEASAMYQAQYMDKDFKNGNSNNDKKSHSKHQGIGKPYFLKHYAQILRLGYIPFGNKKIPIPRYFQKLAHKHYSHFYEKENFFDLSHRKALYRPFKTGEENKKIADLYKTYQEIKLDKIKDLETEWETFINENYLSKEKPLFTLSAENYLYDLKNKQAGEKF